MRGYSSNLFAIDYLDKFNSVVTVVNKFWRGTFVNKLKEKQFSWAYKHASDEMLQLERERE